jgi:PAS domain S-box-containing protein
VSTGLLDAADRTLNGLREEEIEIQFTTSFGKAVWLAFRFIPFHYAGGQHLLVMFTDIEERKRSEAALRESQQRFQELAENIEEVFWMTDPQKDRMLYISPAYEKIWGRTIASLYENPQTWLEGIHPEDRERIRIAAHGRQVDGNYDETYRIVRPDGSIRWIQDRAFPIRDELGRVYRIAGLAEDITARRQLEEQFRQAQKMEAIGTLAGGIAHDFNNILGAICGYTDLAKMDLNEHPEILAHLDSVSQAAARAAALVRQILAFSRKQAQERKVIQLRHIVSEALNLLRATIPATIAFRSSLPPNTHTVLADATQVHQIVMNLATNAWHAMKDKPGVLHVQLENFVVDSAFSDQHPELRPGPYVRLSISDTGQGMDQATIERIFEPFFTTKPPGEGTGLGLSVVHGIMQTHEGTITVESKRGEGTTFRLFFPAHQDEASAGPLASSIIPKGNGQRILLLDDEPPLVSLCKIFLERLGYSVTAHTKVTDAMAAFTANPTTFDLVITDLAMPGMSGTDFAQALMKIQPELPVILMTGYSAQLTVERVQAMGLRDLLMKPLTLETLGNSIHRALSKTKRL